MKRISNQNHSRARSVRADSNLNRVGLLALITAILIALATAVAQGQEPVAQGMTGYVYTADEHGNSISAINLATGAIETVPVPITPHNTQISADGARLLAVGEPATNGHGHGETEAGHESGETAGRLLLLDTGDLTAGPIAEIPVGRHPAHVIADQQGRRAYITNAGDDTVTVIDIVRGELVGTIATGSYPHGLRMSPDGREIYVANVEDGSLSVIDVAGLVETARIPVGKAPVQVGFTPDGSRVYASLRDQNSVAVVDTASRTVIGTIEVGPSPIQVHATPDGRFVYVANQGTEAEPADTVSVIDVAAGSVVDTIRTGKGAHGVAVSADGAFVFVTNTVDGTVSAIDTTTRRVTTAFAVGSGPNGITFRPETAAAAEHDAHHPAQAGSSAATDPAAPGGSSIEGMAGGMPGMMGMMTPEMMKMMQGMMAMQGEEPGRPGMATCPMMREMMDKMAGSRGTMGGPGMGPDVLYGLPQTAQEEMTPESVRAWIDQRLTRHGNARLKIGEITAVGDATITAEILTVDGSLVQKLAFNRYPGLVRQMAE